jgi:phosphoglycerol transferase MdoB-like AlkP superfamily enzyme
MNWIQKNFKTIIYTAFLIPIITVAIVSISHVTKWYGLSNPVSWAIYLSVGIEIAALSALAAISAQMGKKVYFPFIIVTLIQFIGNIFFSYQFIDINSQSFKDWVDMVDPVVSFLGVESGDPVGHKRFLALFAGGMLPIISLSFLHMLVKFEEEEKNKVKPNLADLDVDKLSTEAGKIEKEFVEEKLNPTPEQLEKLEIELQKLNEIKFGNLQEEGDVQNNRKVLSYLRRDA